MSLLLRFKVSGHSMMPTLKPGQEILVSKLPYLFFRPKVGEIIAFRHNDEFIVKRLKQIDEDRFIAKGDNEKDSKKYGWIEKNKIIGRVVYIMHS